MGLTPLDEQTSLYTALLMSGNLEQVVQALHILHGQHTPAEDRRKADLWLTQLRQSPEAWKVLCIQHVLRCHAITPDGKHE